jgi:catechol 2,3-dioxygenase-like lactoylglutathione lyase family enzyme
MSRFNDIRGIEHVGITVPDLDAATRYFAETLGAVRICEVLKSPRSGRDMELMLDVPEGTVTVQIRHLRVGDGPNIELFKYTSDVQRPPVRPTDYGLQHFAVYVDDIDAAAERVRKAGGRICGEIMVLPDYESGPGNRAVYTQPPWGGSIELISTPSPQLYESPGALKKWRPAKQDSLDADIRTGRS